MKRIGQCLITTAVLSMLAFGPLVNQSIGADVRSSEDLVKYFKEEKLEGKIIYKEPISVPVMIERSSYADGDKRTQITNFNFEILRIRKEGSPKRVLIPSPSGYEEGEQFHAPNYVDLGEDGTISYQALADTYFFSIFHDVTALQKGKVHIQYLIP